MNNQPNRILLVCGLSFGVMFAAACASEQPAMPGSIRPTGKLKPAEQANLAKITIAEAMTAALAAAPGKVVLAELEVEGGSLLYPFEVIGSDGKTTEVEIDAGNGKVLGVDHE